MKLLLDTHILIWIAEDSPRLVSAARALIFDPSHQKVFSAASLWELAIKSAARPQAVGLDLEKLERELLARDYEEAPVTSRTARETAKLRLLHKDPFDRLLIAQAIVEGMTLLTADATLARYGGPIRLV